MSDFQESFANFDLQTTKTHYIAFSKRNFQKMVELVAPR